MIKKIVPLFLFFCMLFVAVFGQLIDRKATPETKNLYKNLIRLSGKKVLFGHQDDMAYGVGWKYQEGRSDIKDLTGEYPAVFGWDVSGLETGKAQNIDGVPFEKMRGYIKKAYDMGAINTLSWHMDNPFNGKTSWDTVSVAVRSILPKGEKHMLYKSWLDRFSVFANSLKGTDGKLIPVLFRPFHENGGGWFWWGKKSCSPQEYEALWQFTVQYLRDKKHLHNLIYVFNPCDFRTEEQYLERYPGNNFVDVLSFDYYQYGGIEKGVLFKQDVSTCLAIQNKIAKKTRKLSALAETGFVEIPDAVWWTGVFSKAIEDNKPSYVLFWRNAGYREKEKDNHYYAPYPGQVSAPDFLGFLKGNNILLQKGLRRYSIYK
ncbi:beta-mannosidase [Pedobacter ginsenosidimutans]|uniref:Mannan endo-1,4-beta-mannosidase n=1 Tax=Pedobacter ginsenosidimutans TaxID=687842 RepID=A0A0T5VVK7_9SPHI|nr:glycosyl hydrolase [Pedobacter ginsenosidimutans]KRT17895.1 beta-mannosidase [Pedobacter ginsenosidimutans]